PVWRAPRAILSPYTTLVRSGVPGHALHPGGDEHVALTRLDGVEGHPGGLQRRRAVPGHGRTRDVVQSQHDRDHPGHVEPLLASGDRKSTRLNSSHVKISYAV